MTDHVFRIVQFTFDAAEMLTEHASPAPSQCNVNRQMVFTVGGIVHAKAAGDMIYLAECADILRAEAPAECPR